MAAESRLRTPCIIVCLSVPALVLMGAYIHMALRYNTPWLFGTVVHENGRYTLLQVMLYFRHFLWEAPMKTLYSVLAVGAFFYYGNHAAGADPQNAKRMPVMRAVFIGLLGLALVVLAVFMAGRQFGFREAILGLLQSRASELRPLLHGSHWRNHFLSNIVYFAATPFCILLFRTIATGRWVRRRFWYLLPLSWGAFAAATLAFGLTADPFVTPSYLGHQLREIFGTDLPITMLATVGLLLYLEGKYDRGRGGRCAVERQGRTRALRHFFFWTTPAVLAAAFVVAKVLSLDIGDEMSKLPGAVAWSPLDLFAWHFFEHTLDYVFVLSLVYSLYIVMLNAERAGSQR